MIATPDFDQAPLLVIWETTRACALACRHCRASAIDVRHPDELTHEEACALLDDIAEMGTPIVVFTGGDPLQREDLDDLIRHARGIGLRTGAIPAATHRLTHERVVALKQAGLHQMALSLDGADARSHDDFRQVPGSFLKVMRGALWARCEDLPLQINTVFGAWNAGDFDAIAALVRRLEPVFWEVFFLVPTGRGTALDACSTAQQEELFGKLHALSAEVPFVIKVTEAPHYRRFVAEQRKWAPALAGVGAGHGGGHPGGHPGGGHPGNGRRGGIAFTRDGVNAGKGFCFVDHVGDVYPSGFLPLVVGNVRQTRLSTLYREAPLMRELRDVSLLKGRCGRCPYRRICGGSRSHAYAVTGDYLAEDPICTFEPGEGG
jgi:radical SAM protein